MTAKAPPKRSPHDPAEFVCARKHVERLTLVPARRSMEANGLRPARSDLATTPGTKSEHLWSVVQKPVGDPRKLIANTISLSSDVDVQALAHLGGFEGYPARAQRFWV
jgi:hypothetical protein